MPPAITPTTLGDLRAALIERCQLDINDPRARPAVLNVFINDAVCRFDIANPNSWPWDWRDSGWLPLAAGTGSPYIWTPETYVSKVVRILISNTAGSWQMPLERISREEQLDRYPRDSDVRTPRTYALMGFNLTGAVTEPTVAAYIRPKPDVDYRIRIAGYRPIQPFTSDADPDPLLTDYQIDDWAQLVVEWAAHLVYRASEDLSEALAAQAAFTQGVLDMRRQSRRVYGAGVTSHMVDIDMTAPSP